MITFSIQLPAKSVKHALTLRDELVKAGVKEESIAFPAPMVARSAAPSAPRISKLVITPAERFVMKGALTASQILAHWEKATGSNFKCSSMMAEKFNLPQGQGNRAKAIVKLCQMLASGEVVRAENPTRYLFASEVRANTSNAEDSGDISLPDTSGIAEIDPDFVP